MKNNDKLNTHTIIVLAIAAILLAMPSACNNKTSLDNKHGIKVESNESAIQIPNGWSLHKSSIYSITYPSSMEIRDKGSKYQQDLDQSGIQFPAGNTVIFQQKGLNDKESDAYNKYIRVMITPFIGDKSDFLKADEEYGSVPDYNDYKDFIAWGKINKTLKDFLFLMILQSCQRPDGTYNIVNPKSSEEVALDWEKIGNSYAIKTHYVRNREIGDGQIGAEIYFFQNDSQAVMIVASCPADEYDKTWSEILDPMIQSFRWAHVFK